MGEGGRLLKIREAADALGVDYGTIRGAIEQGLLVAERLEGSFRIRPEALDAYRDRAIDGPSSPRAEAPAPTPAGSPELDDARWFTAQATRWARRSAGPQPTRKAEAAPGSSPIEPAG